MTWKYQTMLVRLGTTTAFETCSELLNRKGEEGWEIISATLVPLGSDKPSISPREKRPGQYEAEGYGLFCVLKHAV